MVFGCSFYFLSNKAVALKLYLSFNAMAKSLIEELPRIASEGRQEAQRIIERLSSGTRIGLQTNECCLARMSPDSSVDKFPISLMHSMPPWMGGVG